MTQSLAETSERDHAWLQSLARHIPLQDVAKLKDQAKQISAGALLADATYDSATSRLLSFYIRRNFENLVGDDDVARDASRADVEVIDAALDQRAQDPEPSAIPVAPSAVSTASPALDDAVRLVYSLTVGREAVDQEVDIWRKNFDNGLAFHDFLVGMHASEEALGRQVQNKVAPELSDGEFVIAAYRLVRRKACTAYELDLVRSWLEKGDMSRTQILQQFFTEELAEDRAGADQAVHDGLSCAIMGTTKILSQDEWIEKSKDKPALSKARAALSPKTPYTVTGASSVRVSAIASLFKGGEFIEQFMDNITSQTIFDKYCELIIVDAESPENEAETIARYLKNHPSINYQRMNSRIGIYEAWNVGVNLSQGEYLTNTNLDDLRRRDSLEIQAGALEALPFVDVVYQDFYYSFDPKLDWEGVAAFGYKSDLPVVTRHNMLLSNAPHNAPMWRKALHKELGGFDANFKSAGDYEFWLRCLSAGKTFYKVNEPHVVYYQNPNGLSTRPDTRGVIEAKEIGKKYTAKLMPHAMTVDFSAFVEPYGDKAARSPGGVKRDRFNVLQQALRNTAGSFKKGAM